MSDRFPLTDSRRIRARDNKLWLRDKARASNYSFSRIQCPCNQHKGPGLPFGIEEVERHLLRYGRSPECRTWRGPEEPDSSDDEWEEQYSASISASAGRPDVRDSGLHMRQMMKHIYQQVDQFIESKEQIDNVTMSALQTADNITGMNADDSVPLDPDCEVPNDAGQGSGKGMGESDDGDMLRADPQTASGHPNSGCEFTEATHSGPQPNTTRVDGPGNQSTDSDEPVLEHNDLEEERVKDAKALEDAMLMLYNGSLNTKLGATVMLVNLIATHCGFTEKAADDMFATVKALLPGDNCLPASLYQAKTLTKRLGLDFQNIHGCPTGCVLFDQPDTMDLERCPKCGAPRYKDMLHKSRPLKVLRFFRVTPRLQRFYRTPILSKLMRWHKENESRDGKVRYPADSQAWKYLDNMNPEIFDTNGFGGAETDVRLQISCDGICPFKLHKSTWSAWPVLTSFLNLPPWLITKKFFTVLSLLIPGRQQVPFQFFDVWMRPLIDELKELWSGVPAYDVQRPEGEREFGLRAAVLYTTHDYPGYGTVSGTAHQGYVACAPCGDQLRGRYSYESRKMNYRDARRWLSHDHFLRSEQFNNLFDGKPENRGPPHTKTPGEQRVAFESYQLYLSRLEEQQRNAASTRSGEPISGIPTRHRQHRGPSLRTSASTATARGQGDHAGL